MDKIELRKLGKSGLSVPALGIGTDSWGEKLLGYGKKYGRDDLYEVYCACLDAGLNFFDTAEGYAKGESERMLGGFHRQDGRPIIIATKFDNPNIFSPSSKSSDSLLKSLDASLKRLDAECIDLYQIHYPVPKNKLDGYMNVLAAAVESGKVRAVGVSNFNAALMRQAHASLAGYGIPLASNQVSYNLLMRYPENNGVLEACRKLDVALILCIPLALGILTGKYRHGAVSANGFQRMFFFTK